MNQLTLLSALFTLVATTGVRTQPAVLTVTDANVTYELSSLPGGPASAGGYARFTANPLLTSNILFQHNWAYRLGGDTRETLFHTAGGQSITVTQPSVDVGVVHWADVDNRGRVSATWTLRAVSTDTSGGITVSTQTITNIATEPITIDLFAYADLDLCSFSDNGAIAGPSATSGTRHQITNIIACALESAEFFGTRADRYEVGAFASVRTKLTDNNLDDLTNTGLPFAPADYTGATQWRARTLLPGESLVATALLAHNHSPCEDPAVTERYGHGSTGTNGMPIIDTTAGPILGTSAAIRVTSGLPNATALVTFGVTRQTTVIQNVTLYNEFLGRLFLTFDAQGAGTTQVAVPNDGRLCGAVVTFQCLYIDPAQSPFPVVHSGGLEWTVGGY